MKINILTASAAEKTALVQLLETFGYKMWSGLTFAQHVAGTKKNGATRGNGWPKYPVVSVRVDTGKIGFAENGEYRDQKTLSQLTAAQNRSVFTQVNVPATTNARHTVRVEGDGIVVDNIRIDNATLAQLARQQVR